MKLKTSFEFDSAHRLVGYKGKCQNIHGHMWKCEIEVQGDKLDDIGIMWDFTNVKLLKDLFDHKTILKDCSDNADIVGAIEKECGSDSVYIMKENPTAENLCKEIISYLKLKNPELKFKVVVWESPKSSCEVYG